MNKLQTLQQALSAMTPQGVMIEVGVLLGSLILAYAMVWLMHGRGRERSPPGSYSIWFGAALYDGVLFPLMALIAGVVLRWSLKGVLPVGLLTLAIPILASLVIIRISVQVLRTAFPKSDLVRKLERSVSWLVWGALVLWLTGVLPLVHEEMEGVTWRLGGADVSLAALVQGALSAGAVLLAVLWLSSTIEARLLKGVVGVDMSARKIAANATRSLLLLVGLLIALSAAGIPMSALSVMGGAVGVGIGLGLQKLAANYVSGFVILAERSLRVGDLVKVDNFEGYITDIKSRYTVIRAGSGRESIVPNEMMITQRVENASLADRNVMIATVVQVAYGSDMATLMPQLQATMVAVPRVLKEPAPSVQLTSFASDGLELTMNFWVADPENGQGNVRSEVNLALLAALDAAGVDIPFPQRVLRVVPLPGALPGELPTALPSVSPEPPAPAS